MDFLIRKVKRKVFKWFVITLLIMAFVMSCCWWLYWGNSSNDEEIYMDLSTILEGGYATEDGISPLEIPLYDLDGKPLLDADGNPLTGPVNALMPLNRGDYRISSRFGPRNTGIPGASKYHKGIDLAAPMGTPVYSVMAGTVIKAGSASGYGQVIYVQHNDGTVTRYGHVSTIDVKVGDTVSAGQKIGGVGNEGVSSGPHLHFEYLINGKQVNPELYFDF